MERHITLLWEDDYLHHPRIMIAELISEIEDGVFRRSHGRDFQRGLASWDSRMRNLVGSKKAAYMRIFTRKYLLICVYLP